MIKIDRRVVKHKKNCPGIKDESPTFMARYKMAFSLDDKV